MSDLSKARKRFDEVAHALDRLDEHLAITDEQLFAERPDVSGWSIAGHLHHIAVSNGLMLAGVNRCCREEAPAEPGGRTNAIGRAVLLSGRMPRGRGKAPDVSVPPPHPERKAVVVAMARSRKALAALEGLLEQLPKASWRVAHPYFGPLSAMEWLRLTAIHTDHHIRIIEEIQNAA